jgi:hypothetical protein
MLLPSPTSLKRPRALHHRLSTILLLVFLLSIPHHLPDEFLRQRLIEWKLNRPFPSFIWSQFRFESSVRRWRRVKPNVLVVTTKIDQRLSERLERGHMITNGFARFGRYLVNDLPNTHHSRFRGLIGPLDVVIDGCALGVFHSASSEECSACFGEKRRGAPILSTPNFKPRRRFITQ